MSVVVWFSDEFIGCAVTVDVDRFKRFDNDVVEATVFDGVWRVVVDGPGLVVAVVTAFCVDVCAGVATDVEEVVIFVVLATGDTDVVPVFSAFVVVCGNDSVQIYSWWSMMSHEILCKHLYK